MTGEAWRVTPLFAEVLLIWQAANYLMNADPARSRHSQAPSRKARKWLALFIVRACGAAALSVAIAGWWPGAVLGCAMLTGCILLPVARWLWVPSRHLAELEVGTNVAFAGLAQFTIAYFNLPIGTGPLRLSTSDSLIPASLFTAALLIFVVRGGTFIVRGILDRAGTMPPQEAPAKPATWTGLSAINPKQAFWIDTAVLNHGRLIGNIERLILVLFVANGEFTALAFFFAAKGLIRSKDVERRAWADYLILGSLTSFLVAVAAGLLIRAAFRAAAH